MTVRLPDWEPRIAAYLDACAKRPFVFGSHDCALFAAGAVEALTGEDFGAPFRGRYSTVRGYKRALTAAGYSSIEGPFTAALGEPVGALMARRGDIVTDGESMGVMWTAGTPVGLFVGGGTADAAEYEVGLVTLPVRQIVRAWRVG